MSMCSHTRYVIISSVYLTNNGVANLSAHGLVRSHDVLGHMTYVSFVLCEFTVATTLPEGRFMADNGTINSSVYCVIATITIHTWQARTVLSPRLLVYVFAMKYLLGALSNSRIGKQLLFKIWHGSHLF